MYMYANNNPIKYYDPTGHSVLVLAGIALSSKALLAAGATVILSIIIASNSDAIAQTLDNAFSEFASILSSVVSSIPSLWDRLTKSAKTEIHHIIAQSAIKAAPARNHALSHGIIARTDPNNLVPLKMRFHRKLHTNLYYASINAVIVPQRSKSDIYI